LRSLSKLRGAKNKIQSQFFKFMVHIIYVTSLNKQIGLKIALTNINIVS